MSAPGRRCRAALAGLLAGCAGPQSALDPAGPAAAAIDRLGTIMWVAGTAVVLLVTALMLVPFVRRRERGANRRLFLWGGGVALPFLTLTALVPYVLTLEHGTRLPVTDRGLSVDVTGHRFWWAMSYRVGGEASGVASGNELRVPVGEPVELLLRAEDVIHSFWVPRLAGKTDLIPGRVNRMVLRADRPGVYRGQCAEFCGRQHALMAFEVVAMPKGEFDVWLRRQARPTAEPSVPELAKGRDLFVSRGCGACHTVRGLTDGRLGPDLTGVGGRRYIGAGAVRGGAGNIGGWIASAQHLKPGNAMPSFTQLRGEELRALSAWLESLK